MKIAFNPSNSNKNILDLIKNNKDIIFDLKGHSIFARGVEFKGTDTWRPVVDNLTSDSTTSSLSANQGRVLKALINGKSDSGHTHDDRYLKLTGGTMTGNIILSRSNAIIKPLASTSNYDSIVSWSVDGETKKYGREIGLHNLGGSNSTGSIAIVPYKTDTEPWSGTVGLFIAKNTLKLDGKPIAFKSDIPTSLKNPYSLTLQANGTTLATYDGSVSKIVNLTYDNVGAAAKNHTHNSLEPWASYITGDSHATALKSIFDKNKTSIPRNKFISMFSSTYDNGSYYMGYFLNGYENAPYGGFFVAHYDTAYYIGISNGSFTQHRLVYSTDIPNSLKNPHALTISLNGASQGPYDGSTAKSINITPGSIGAATSEHNHDGRYLALSGGTMTGTIRFNNLIDIDSAIVLDYKYSEGGFARDIVSMKNSVYEDANLGALAILCYPNSTSNGFQYIYLGTDKYDGPNNLRIYKDKVTFGNNILIDAGNIGSQSVAYASKAGNADKLDGYHASYSSSTPWGTIPVITTQGFMDIGKHLEFHFDNTTGSDYSTLLTCTGNYSNIVNLPSASGTLALLSQVVSISDFNWTNLPGKVVAGNEFNIVNAGFNNQLYFNYLPIDNRNGSAAISQYIMGNGNKGLASVYAYRFKVDGKSCMWKDARNYAPFYATFNGGFEPILDIKTKGGDWSIGSYDAFGNHLVFAFTSDSDYNAGVNGTAQYWLSPGGEFKINTLRLAGPTTANMGVGSTNPQIIFAEDSTTQQVALTYTDWDAYRVSKGLKVHSYDGSDDSNVWFEVQGYNYSSGYVKNGSSNSYVLLGGGGHKPLSEFQLGSGSYLPYNGWWASGSGQDINDANGMIFAYANHKNSPFSSAWGIITTFDYTYNSNYKFQLAANGYSNAMYYRSRSYDRGGWTSWAQVIDTGNIGSQRVSYATSAGSVSNSLNIFGVSYNGSAAKTVTTSTFVSQLPEATGTVTDGTMFITSWASDNGFADTNAVNFPYKRKASCLWNYIDNKVSSKYLPLAGGTMNGNARIGHGSGNLYIGNSGNDGWIYTQDIASQSGTDKWNIRVSGAAQFGNIHICAKSDYATYDSSIIECYTGNNLYLNYYSPRGINLCNGGGTVQIGSYTAGDTGGNKLYVNGSEFINGASNVKDHVFANGFRHRSHNSNDSVLLAGGGYSQGVPVRYWAIYSMYIGNSSTDVTYTKRSGNYNFITSEAWESEGAARFDISFPSGYNKNNTLIFGNGDHRTSSSWKTPVYVTITTSTAFGGASQIRVMISDDASLNVGFANIYFMCMG